MRHPLFSVFWTLLILGINGVSALTSYANDFVDPDYIVARKFGNNTLAAQATVLAWAKASALVGPWSVTNRSVAPPSGSKHDYMSWAPYWWPDCSKIGNTTELTPEEVWKTCLYVSRDGQFNPDGRLVNNVGDFASMADAIFYNAIAFSLTSEDSSSYSKSVVLFIRTWFLDDDTKMNPNLNFGQMRRGPEGQAGSHTGVLDLKGMTKIVSAIMILRRKNCTDWTSELDAQMNTWTREYIAWLETAPIAVEEGLSGNNHGTFYYNQLAALKLLIGDRGGALNVTNTYFASQYMFQIVASGEQPFEVVRTRPYHYHAYNLAGMITNARISSYAGDKSVWDKTTNEGATIKTAMDFAMQLEAARSNEASYIEELYPSVAAVASVYGDTDGRYSSFLANGAPGYTEEPYFLWNQPLEGGESRSTSPSKSPETTTNVNVETTGSPSSLKKEHNNATQSAANCGFVAVIVASLYFVILLLDDTAPRLSGLDCIY